MVIQVHLVKIQFFKCYEEFFEGVMLNLFQHLFGDGSAEYLVQLTVHWTLKHVQGDRAEILDNAHSTIGQIRIHLGLATHFLLLSVFIGAVMDRGSRRCFSSSFEKSFSSSATWRMVFRFS